MFENQKKTGKSIGRCSPTRSCDGFFIRFYLVFSFGFDRVSSLVGFLLLAIGAGFTTHFTYYSFFFLIFIEPNPLLLTRDLIFFCFKYRFFFSFQNEGGVGRPNGETAAHPRLDFGAHGPAGRRPAGLQPPKVHARFGPTLGKKKKTKNK